MKYLVLLAVESILTGKCVGDHVRLCTSGLGKLYRLTAHVSACIFLLSLVLSENSCL